MTGLGGGLATRVSSRMPDGSEADFYFYLQREGPFWRVAAMRTLALTGVVEMAREQLRSAPATRENTENLRKIELTLSSDRRLRDWFVRHRAEIEALVTPLPALKEASICKELGLTAVEREDGVT